LQFSAKAAIQTASMMFSILRRKVASRGAQPRHHLAPSRRREGAPRSDLNTNGDGGSWSRLSRRIVRSSTPLNG
jgi:hypothetical protein